MDVQELWSKVENLAYKNAWRYSGRYGMEWEDLVSIQRVALIERAGEYDSEKGRLTTFFQPIFQGAILDACKKQKRSIERASHESEITLQAFTLLDFLDTPDVKEVAVRVFNPDMLKSPPKKNTPTSLRAAIIRDLQSLGWNRKRTAKAFGTLKCLLD